MTSLDCFRLHHIGFAELFHRSLLAIHRVCLTLDSKYSYESSHTATVYWPSGKVMSVAEYNGQLSKELAQESQDFRSNHANNGS